MPRMAGYLVNGKDFGDPRQRALLQKILPDCRKASVDKSTGYDLDGNYILYAGSFREGESKGTTGPGSGPLWIMSPEGEEHSPLSGPYLFGWSFDALWSPTGQWVAYTGQDQDQNFGCVEESEPDSAMCRFKGTAVYIENVVTGEVRRLAAGIEPVWSPDGSQLTFISIQSGAPEIWQVQIDGENLRQLTSDGQSKKMPIIWVPTKR